jgi:heptaprenyl diphosphate synthase
VNSDHEWLVCRETRNELRQIEPLLARAVEAEDPGLRAIATHLVLQKGKRLRPALALLGGKFGSTPSEDSLMRASTALELLHAGSLYHDDVMDRAELRRHQPSANATWGNVLASIAGTYIMARATAELASLGTWVNNLASRALVKVSTGQMLEIEHAYDLDLTEHRLLNILSSKTATLFELPLRLGSFLAGASEEHVEALATYGREVGLAFQLVDDALDFTGEETAMGKQTGRDLRAGVYSLPVLIACGRADQGQQLRDLLEKLNLCDEDMNMATSLIRRSGAIEETLALARQKADNARASLDTLPDISARLSLHQFAEEVVTRRS